MELRHRIPARLRSLLPCCGLILLASLADASVEDHLRDRLRLEISNHVAVSTDTAIYSSIDWSRTNFVRNTNCWLDAPQLTAVSPWNSSSPGRIGQQVGFAISHTQIVAARHAPPGIGTVICFVTLRSSNVFRTIVSAETFGNHDLWLGTLDEPLPSNIYPLDILNTDILRTSPEVSLPAIFTNQKQEVFCYNWRIVRPNATWSSAVSYFPQIPGVLTFGDSGHPVFIMVADRLVAFSLATGIHSGPNLREVLGHLPAMEVAPYPPSEIRLH